MLFSGSNKLKNEDVVFYLNKMKNGLHPQMDDLT